MEEEQKFSTDDSLFHTSVGECTIICKEGKDGQDPYVISVKGRDGNGDWFKKHEDGMILDCNEKMISDIQDEIQRLRGRIEQLNLVSDVLSEAMLGEGELGKLLEAEYDKC